MEGVSNVNRNAEYTPNGNNYKKSIISSKNSIYSETNYDISLKLVVIGESGVGKSNLILRFKENRFDEDLMPTVGLDFYSEDFNIKDKKIRVQIWDTAGQEKY